MLKQGRNMTPTKEELESVNFDEFSVDDIYCLIDLGLVKNSDVIHFYNNSQWDDTMGGE